MRLVPKDGGSKVSLGYFLLQGDSLRFARSAFAFATEVASWNCRTQQDQILSTGPYVQLVQPQIASLGTIQASCSFSKRRHFRHVRLLREATDVAIGHRTLLGYET